MKRKSLTANLFFSESFQNQFESPWKMLYLCLIVSPSKNLFPINFRIKNSQITILFYLGTSFFYLYFNTKGLVSGFCASLMDDSNCNQEVRMQYMSTSRWTLKVSMWRPRPQEHVAFKRFGNQTESDNCNSMNTEPPPPSKKCNITTHCYYILWVVRYSFQSSTSPSQKHLWILDVSLLLHEGEGVKNKN